MKTKANYFKIGVFVLLVLGMLIAGLIALSARELIRDTIALETYIDESVLGLSVGSPVMQRGVQIGTVRQISFVPQEYGPELGELSDSAFQKYNRYVLVVAEVNRAALPSLPHNNEVANVIRESVANGLRLKISPQGITGIYYLEADYFDPQRYPYIPVPWTPKRYYIPWAPSTLTSFTQSADRI
ncbi:MAG TPA: MCE family protein, partial [Phycisphaerales bacterium]|nr:MCE family protein [Phycisphaerales bacterium]